MKTKQCTTCKEKKSTAAFNKRSRSKDGLNAVCRECWKLKAAIQRVRHKDKRKVYDQQYRAANPDYAREWRTVHREHIREYGRTYRRSHPPKPRTRLRSTKPSQADRFWSHVDKSGECWVWTGNRYPNGYGRFGHDGYAHRMSYRFTYGNIPPNMCICHHCDNPPCVRPDHLFLGTHADNMRDRDAKGRGKVPKHR